jgi:hypothetical protein
VSQQNQTATCEENTKAGKADKFSMPADQFDAALNKIAKELGPVVRPDATPDMQAILEELEEAFDKEIYPEQVKEDFDAPDDREYSVTITAKQWRAMNRALSKAGAK